MCRGIQQVPQDHFQRWVPTISGLSVRIKMVSVCSWPQWISTVRSAVLTQKCYLLVYFLVKEYVVFNIHTSYICPHVAPFCVNNLESFHGAVQNFLANGQWCATLRVRAMGWPGELSPYPHSWHLISWATGQLMVLVIETARTKVSWWTMSLAPHLASSEQLMQKGVMMRK